jgi:hypothetical protein
MVTHLHVLFVASHNTTTVQSFNSSCPRTPTVTVASSSSDGVRCVLGSAVIAVFNIEFGYPRSGVVKLSRGQRRCDFVPWSDSQRTWAVKSRWIDSKGLITQWSGYTFDSVAHTCPYSSHSPPASLPKWFRNVTLQARISIMATGRLQMPFP